MGWGSAFNYDRPADIYREHARLSTYDNKGTRLFEMRRDAAIGNPAYDAMEPWLWSERPFAPFRFFTPDGKARLVVTVQAPLADPLKAWPLTLNTGRYRDQWHTMTRTGLSPRLARHREEPLVEINPHDCERLGLSRRRHRAGRDAPRREPVRGSSPAMWPAARRDLYPDPLDGSPVDRRPHRPAAALADRSAFGPARLQIDSGKSREGRDRMAGLPDRPWRAAASTAKPVGDAGHGAEAACSTKWPRYRQG